MNISNISAPLLDGLINACQHYPEVKNASVIKDLLSIAGMLFCIEKQGDDEYRNIWITAERGKIEDFGDFNEYLEEGEVNSPEDFTDLWHCYYPDELKWYNFAITKYKDVFYFYLDSKLTLQFNENESSSETAHDFQTKLTDWLLKITEDVLASIRRNVQDYNDFISINLPHKKRTGRIVRSDFWSVFPEQMEDFQHTITPEILKILEKIKFQSESKSFRHLTTLTSGDFFRFCEIGYDANKYFDDSNKPLTAKEKYAAMADGRDCGLKLLPENSIDDFATWFETGRNCGGHPWEICRGGNSTHISLYVCHDEKGWYLRLEGSSIARVIETIKIAVALYDHKIPFILGKAEEIHKMADGLDYIGIVPETVFPRYCHGYFPDEDKIIDFMNLGTERNTELIAKAFWYPIPELKMIK